MSDFAYKQFDRVVERILSGQAVFLIGAGFSLDSEGNTATRLIARLLARFCALWEFIGQQPNTLEDLADGLRITFRLGGKPLTAEQIVSECTVQAVAQQYYLINEWICAAYQILLGELLDGKPVQEVARFQEQLDTCVSKRENELFKVYRQDPVPLKPFDLVCYHQLSGYERGKALFLETMGFLDRNVMCGDPKLTDLGALAASYRSVLRERHHVLARLAREGLCPLLLTTNYDMLLEGACRMAGFYLQREHPSLGALDPPATYKFLSRIASPADFFESGAGYRSALLVKIHGCADRYREVAGKALWSAYLPSMVFTYREIQNWRKDSWSRDLISTLLRTRTMILCGYSGADPVVHDTFRTVYEELGAQRAASVSGDEAAREVAPEQGRAFFTGSADSCEFHGLEILRAASRAAGAADAPLARHPNYLPFYFGNDDQHRFPTLDEVLVWVWHRLFRRLQAKALETDLRRVVTMLLNRRVRETALKGVRDDFAELCHQETAAVGKWDDTVKTRWWFHRMTGWTSNFHPALLREFALAETVVRNHGPGLDLERLRAARCYYPVLDQPGWAAWGAVMEIALRKMFACWRGTPGEWATDFAAAEAADSEYPALLFSKTAEELTPACLLMRVGSALVAGQRPHIRGVYRRVHLWQWSTVFGTKPGSVDTPGAEAIWQAVLQAPDSGTIGRWLGESDAGKSAAA